MIALRLGAAFVPVRKRGKLPGVCERAAFEKEYGVVCVTVLSFAYRFYVIYPATRLVRFRMNLRCRQTQSCRDRRLSSSTISLPRVRFTSIVVMAPRYISFHIGGSAAAAGDLVAKQGGQLLRYMFIAEVAFLNGKDKLNAPTYSMVQFDQ